jgi:hypothetical protein
MRGEGGHPRLCRDPALQDVDTGPSPGMTPKGKCITPDDLLSCHPVVKYHDTARGLFPPS